MSRFILLPFCLFLAIQPSNGQDWTWLGGNKGIDELTNGNHPGGRSGSSVWHDKDRVWMFGGKGFTDLSTGEAHVLNDLWSFSVTLEEFDLENPGSQTSFSFSPTSAIPSERQYAALCGSNKMLFVFGGFGKRGSALGDLWTYNTIKKEWTLITKGNESSEEGPAARGDASVWCYGTSMFIFGGLNDNKTVFDDMWELSLSSLEWRKLFENSGTAIETSNNLKDPTYPSARSGAAVWVSGENFYMFGGSIDPVFSFILQRVTRLTSDLWKFNPSNSTWQFVAGNLLPGQHSVYNEVSYAHSSNHPGCRIGAAAWTDTANNLWLFGGAGADVQPVSEYHDSKLLSDLWRFHIYTNSWAFMGGSDRGGKVGNYGPLGESVETNLLSARTRMASLQSKDNLAYIFGGLGQDTMHYGGYLSDLWRVDISKSVTRNFMVSLASLLIFLGISVSLLAGVLVLSLYSRQTSVQLSNGTGHMTGARYSRLKSTDT